jgi:predicted deacylase
MRVEVHGGTSPAYGIVGSLHGDERCGKNVIEWIGTDLPELQEPVKTVVAHTEALTRKVKYIDQDLNRAFPGDSTGSSYEARLAANILQEVRGMNVLDLHSTVSQPTPFAIAAITSEQTKLQIASTGLSTVVDISKITPTGSLIEQTGGVSVECGIQGEQNAVDNGVDIVRNYLAANGLIDQRMSLSNPTVYQITDTEDVPEDADIEILCNNFTRVSEGSAYARVNNEIRRADEAFYPVLMSEKGYKDRGQLGFKAILNGDLFTDERFRSLCNNPRNSDCRRTQKNLS